MRNYVDPKRFYKASDKVSKFVQASVVIFWERGSRFQYALYVAPKNAGDESMKKLV